MRKKLRNLNGKRSAGEFLLYKNFLQVALCRSNLKFSFQSSCTTSHLPLSFPVVPPVFYYPNARVLKEIFFKVVRRENDKNFLDAT